MKVNQITSGMLRKASVLAERIETRVTKFNEAVANDLKAFQSLTGQAYVLSGVISSEATTATPAKTGKRVMSAATKAKIAAGQAKRWANQKAAPTATEPVTKPAATPATTPVSAPTAPVAAK